MAGQIYGKLKLSMYYYVSLCITVLRIMLWICLCKQANICISVLLHVSLRKSTPEILVKFFLFTFFINFFMKTLIKSIIYCQTVPLDHLSAYVYCKTCMPGLSAFGLNLSKSGNILFRKMSNGEIVGSASLSLVGEITHWCMNFDCLDDGSCWAACKCNICPTFCIKISSWKGPISNSR